MLPMPNEGKKSGQEAGSQQQSTIALSGAWVLPYRAIPWGQTIPVYVDSVCPLLHYSGTILTWTQKPGQLVPEARGPPRCCC